MVDYTKGKIYKMICNKTGLIYIGSTVQKLKKRLQEHKSNYKMYLEGSGKKNISSFKIIENNDYKIELLEECGCSTKEELHSRERFYIENTECVNKIIPIRSDKENREKKNEYRKEHKDKIRECNKEYYEKVKDKIVKKRKETYTCDCGSTLTKHSKSSHEKSNKHQNFLFNNKDE